MSEYRVGIIAEGPTDVIMLEQIIRILGPKNKQVVVTAISPTETELMHAVPKPEGFGWGGVYKVCRDLEWKLAMQREAGIHYDLIIVHVDGDVSYMTYQSANIIPSSEAGELPSYNADMTVEDNCMLLKRVVSTWLAFKGSQIVYCIPYINMDIWAAFSLYPQDRSSINEKWTEDELNAYLLMKGKKEGRLVRRRDGKIRKFKETYHKAAQMLTNVVWNELIKSMRQAACFEADVMYSEGMH